jgi:MioC protein
MQMNTPVTILVGTTTGNAQYCAEEAQFRLGEAGFDATVQPMDGLDATALAAPGVYLVVVSTYGQGDVPDNARPLYESLIREKPALGHVRYGLVSLGDSSHAQTFCFAGRRFDTQLAKLGASRIGDVLNHDASSGIMPEEATADWLGPWIDQLSPATAA